MASSPEIEPQEKEDVEILARDCKVVMAHGYRYH